MELNVDKAKIMRFRKGKGRTIKKDWWWRGKKIEEIKEFIYLGCRCKRMEGRKCRLRREQGRRS